MDFVESVLIEEKITYFDKNCQKGDLISFYYNTVGHKAKTKKIIGVYQGLYGKGVNKMVRVIFTKSGLTVRLSLPINLPLFQGFRVLKRKN